MKVTSGGTPKNQPEGWPRKLLWRCLGNSRCRVGAECGDGPFFVVFINHTATDSHTLSLLGDRSCILGFLPSAGCRNAVVSNETSLFCPILRSPTRESVGVLPEMCVSAGNDLTDYSARVRNIVSEAGLGVLHLISRIAKTMTSYLVVPGGLEWRD